MAEFEQDQEDGEGKKSPKKLIIIIVAAVLLLAAGGGVTFYLMKGSSAKGGDVEHVEEEEPEEPGEKLYFTMSKPLVVDFPQGASAQHARITLSMLVGSDEMIEVLKKNEPMIRSNLLMLISAQDSNALNTREGKEALRKAIADDVTAVIIKMAGKGKVDEIFFTSFVMQ
jgi:flagellar FliL protein